MHKESLINVRGDDSFSLVEDANMRNRTHVEIVLHGPFGKQAISVPQITMASQVSYPQFFESV